MTRTPTPAPTHTQGPRVLAVPSPVGDLYLAATDRAVVALVFRKADLGRLGITAGDGKGSTPLLETAARQLREYFGGKRTAFDCPLDLQGTAFQRKVWDALRRIPYGETWSYAELAKQVGNPGAVRAVGTANGRNPVCILVPCHRVIRSTGETGGYAGGPERKVRLLEIERARRP
jgi:methylated-DNA-[protein]-cysteine S-methyltransferase